MNQRTDEELNATIGEWHTGRLFAIQKRGLYYRPNGNGYTGNADEAWRLPLDEAKKHEYNPKGCDEPVLVIALPWKNYCRDLNACHEAEKRIFDTYDRSAWFRFVTELRNTSYCGGNATQEDHVHATARQRAEALVKVIEQQKGQK